MLKFREPAGRRHFLAVLEAKAERMPGAARAIIQNQISALRLEIARREAGLAGIEPTEAQV